MPIVGFSKSSWVIAGILAVGLILVAVTLSRGSWQRQLRTAVFSSSEAQGIIPGRVLTSGDHEAVFTVQLADGSSQDVVMPLAVDDAPRTLCYAASWKVKPDEEVEFFYVTDNPDGVGWKSMDCQQTEGQMRKYEGNRPVVPVQYKGGRDVVRRLGAELQVYHFTAMFGNLPGMEQSIDVLDTRHPDADPCRVEIAEN